jgi:hypothetical protein
VKHHLHGHDVGDARRQSERYAGAGALRAAQAMDSSRALLLLLLLLLLLVVLLMLLLLLELQLVLEQRLKKAHAFLHHACAVVFGRKKS